MPASSARIFGPAGSALKRPARRTRPPASWHSTDSLPCRRRPDQAAGTHAGAYAGWEVDFAAESRFRGWEAADLALLPPLQSGLRPLAVEDRRVGGGAGPALYGGIENATLLDEMCGASNAAAYGDCVATSYASLAVVGFPPPRAPAHAGLPILISVRKLDAYGQVIASDSSSLLQAQGSGVSVVGPAVASLAQGEMQLSLVLKPEFALVRPGLGLAVVGGQPSLQVRGIDAQSSTVVTMLSPAYPVFFAGNRSVCPAGSILVLEEQSANASKLGSCAVCPAGSYSVDPLAGATPETPSCFNCPPSAKCNGGDDVDLPVGAWRISNGVYVLVACPYAHQLVNSIGGKFSQDVQECVSCLPNQYILNPNVSAYSCQDCPVGAVCNGESLQGLIPGSTWEADLATGQYVLTSCPAGYTLINTFNDGVRFSFLNQECMRCPATFFCVGGNAAAQACPQGSFSPAGSNSSAQCAQATFVLITVTLPLSLVNFTAQKQAAFSEALALALGQSAGQVLLDSIATARRSAPGAVIIHSRVAVDSAAAANVLVNKLDQTLLNEKLFNAGLPPCSLMSVNVQYVGLQSTGTPVSVLIGSIIGSVSFLFLVGGMVLIVWNREVQSDYEKRLAIEMAALRKRLKISRKDGFLLSSERAFWWDRIRGWTLIQKNYLEAAAQLGLMEDFDVHQFDAFCLCLECESLDKQGIPGLHTAYEALGDWLLDICKDLIKPDLRGYEGLPVEEFMADSCNLPIEERFHYFRNKICRARIWGDKQNALFARLKEAAKVYMGTVAALCDERFKILSNDECGRTLIAYPSTATETQSSDDIQRQDHPMVRTLL